VAIVSQKNVRFELRDPDLVQTADICNIWKQFTCILQFLPLTNLGAGSPKALKKGKQFGPVLLIYWALLIQTSVVYDV
jgi:hypothetical protein